MANIFGRKELTEKIETNVGKNNDISEKEAVGSKDTMHGVVTINSGTITDYFKAKLTSMPTYDKVLAGNTADNGANDTESKDDRIGFGFGFAPKAENASSIKDSDEKSNYAFDNPCLGLNSPLDCSNSTSDADNTPKKSKKKKKKRQEFENAALNFNEGANVQKKLKTAASDSNCTNVFTNPALNLDAESEEDRNNGKEFEVSRAEFGLENCGLDLTDEKHDKKRVTFSDHVMLYEYNADSKKKKKREGQATLDKFEVENKKQKKKRKYESIATPVSDGIINEALDIEIMCDEINDNELNEHWSKKSKRRKICKVTNLETIQESPEQEKEIIHLDAESETIASEDEKSKKKKKRKVKVEEIIEADVKGKEEADIKIVETVSGEVKKDRDKEGGILSLKKCKKKKKEKKDKESCKAQLKHTAQSETSSDDRNNDVLEEPDMKRENVESVVVVGKNAIKIEGVTVESPEDVERKKKKRKNKKSADKEDCLTNEISVCDGEREISDKENKTDKTEDPVVKNSGKKDKKRKKSQDTNASCNTEVTDTASGVKAEKTEIIESDDTSLKKNRMTDVIDNVTYSPSKARISKKRLLAFFYNNPKASFPDSNIHDIKGYSEDN